MLLQDCVKKGPCFDQGSKFKLNNEENAKLNPKRLRGKNHNTKRERGRKVPLFNNGINIDRR